MTGHEPTAGNILLVDDDRTSRAVLRAFLLREGHEIHVASDGAQGVEV